MKTKRQLRRELIRAKARIRELEEDKETELDLLEEENTSLLISLKNARESEQAARDMVDKMIHINDVLCAELQQDDQFIDMIRMAVEQLHTRAELLNRITGPMV